MAKSLCATSIRKRRSNKNGSDPAASDYRRSEENTILSPDSAAPESGEGKHTRVNWICVSNWNRLGYRRVQRAGRGK